MGKGGKYLKQSVPKAKKKFKGLKIILIVFLSILLIAIIAGFWYYNHLLSMMTRPDEQVDVSASAPTDLPELSSGNVVEIDGVAVTEETSPEDTWPVVVSDKNITNIMLVGQAAREGEEALIADTMILCSINRETKTLTMTSLMRDMRLVWPEYVDYWGKSHTGNNRINMAYNMGYRWANNNIQGGMDLLASIVEYNFGVHVDHTIQVDFAIFMQICDIVGGVWVDFDEDEIQYMLDNYGDHSPNHLLVPGYNYINGWQALCYARMRKVGHGDYERTDRQREVIGSLLYNIKDMNILDIHNMFTEILPMITTDMTNQEITNYAFEFIPMLKDLNVQSQRIPFDGNEKSVSVEIDGVMDYQIAPRDLKATAKQLQESIGMTVTEE